MRFRTSVRWCAVVAGMPLALGLPAADASAQGASASARSGSVAVSVPCSPGRTAALNRAIEAANDHPRKRWNISLQAGCTYTVTEPYGGVNGLTAVTGDVRISSRGASRATIARSAAAGTARFRVLEVEMGGRLVLDRVTVRGGASPGSGAGIFNNFGTLTLDDSALVGNDAADFGGGLTNNGQGATSTLNDSVIRDGSAVFGGGAVFNNGGSVRLNASRVTSNDVTEGIAGGIFNNGHLSRLTLDRSTVTGNQARQTAGGILNGGSVTSRNSRIARNLPNNCAGSTAPVPGCAD